MTVLRVVDVETNGMEATDQVVEVGYCDLTKGDDGAWSVGQPVSWLCGADRMPPEVRAVHHITLADVAGLASFDAARVVEPHLSAVVAHNWSFEALFFGQQQTPAICTLKAALRVWPDAPGHSNGVLRYWLEDQGLLALDHATAMPPHRAGPDAYVTAHILKALFAAGATGRDMIAWTQEPRLLPTCPIGKFRVKAWADVEMGFLTWMLAQPTMEADLKWNAQREIDRRRGCQA
jgi:exodeoxyribonuclease X